MHYTGKEEIGCPDAVFFTEAGSRTEPMSFKIANQEFEKLFGETHLDSSPRLYADFIAMLREHLDSEHGESAKRMKAWLDKDGELSSFCCRQDALDAMHEKLVYRKVPYVLVRGTNGKMIFLIRKKDEKAARDAAGAALSELAGTCRLTNGHDAGMTYLRGKSEDKHMLIIGGLSREEAFYFMDHSGKVLPGETIGVDQMPDETYTLTVHGKTAMHNPRSFPGAVVKAVVMLSGERGEKEKENIRNRIGYLSQKARGFPDRDGGTESPVWIVGMGSCFVKRTADGFEAGHAVTVHDDVLLETDYAVKKDTKKYGERLNSALSRTTGHICLYTVGDVLEYYRTPKPVLRDPEQLGCEKLIDQACEIVARKTFGDRTMIMNEHWDSKFRHLQKELCRVLEGAALGKSPRGYQRGDIAALRNTAERFGLTGQAIMPGISRFAGLDSYSREAGVQRVKDIGKLIAQYRGEQQKQPDDRDPSKSRSTQKREDR